MSRWDMARRTEIRVKFNNVDITEDLNQNLISLTYTDATDGETDDLKITMHDRDNKWLSKWLKKELEQRDQANRDIAQGVYLSGNGEFSGATYTVNARIGLNVRTGRGTGYKKIGVLPYGTTVSVSEIKDGWATIQYSGATAYVCAQYLTKSGGVTAPGGGDGWTIGEEVIVTGRARSNSYGIHPNIGHQVTNHVGRITYLNLRSGIPYPICVDSLGWYALECVTKKNAPANTMDGRTTPSAKYTKINAVISALNVDGKGTDRVLDCGVFELDDVSVTGPPQRLELSATSLSYESTIRKTKRSRNWTNSTLQRIATTISKNGGYELMYLSTYDPTFKSIRQNDKSDIDFLYGLCEKYGMKIKVTDGNIVIYDAKDMEKNSTVSTIRRGKDDYIKYKFRSSLSTTAYSSCHVSYEDDQGNKYEGSFTPTTAYSEGEVLEVTEQVGSNAEAVELAKRKLRIANKGEMTGSFTVPGDPRYVAGANIEITGWGDFDGKWTIDKAVHKVSGGYTTGLEISKVIEGY